MVLSLISSFVIESMVVYSGSLPKGALRATPPIIFLATNFNTLSKSNPPATPRAIVPKSSFTDSFKLALTIPLSLSTWLFFSTGFITSFLFLETLVGSSARIL